MYIFNHKSDWKLEYTLESEAVISSYGKGLELHHIGSTAIKGLSSKDCIDMLGVVSDISMVSNKNQALVDLGYTYRGDYGINGREYFSKKDRKVHLHIFEAGDSNIKKHLNFVEVMQGNPKLVDELNALKNQLHKKFPNSKETYQSEKKYFYDKIHQLI